MDVVFGRTGPDVIFAKQFAQGRAMIDSDSTVIPRWLWAGIGILILAVVGGLGSLATWTLMAVVDGKTADQVHDIRIMQLETQYHEIRQSQDIMISKLNGIEVNGKKLEDLAEKMDKAMSRGAP